MVAAALALLAAAVGEALGRMPADAAAAALRCRPPRSAGRQLATATARSLAALAAAVGAAATAGAAPAAVAVGLLPLAAAPVTAAPLIGAPLRLALLAWCAARLTDRGVPPVALVAAFVAGVAVWAALGPRRLGDALRQTVRDTVSVLVASPIVVAACVPLLVGLTLAPWELWRRCHTRLERGTVQAGEGTELSVVFLDGVGKTWRPPTRVARELVDELRAAAPGTRFVTDVLPYSPLQRPLTERRGTGPVWRWLRRRAFSMLVGRNILQTVVASDARYQQAFGAAIATAVGAALARAGHRKGDRIALVGYSGGAVVAVAAAGALENCVVVSVGGYLDGRVLPRHAVVHHIASTADRIERLGRAMFPSRWRITTSSVWNRGLAAGRVVLHPVAGSRHIGPSGYLSSAEGPPGSTHLRRTVAVTAGLLHGAPSG